MFQKTGTVGLVDGVQFTLVILPTSESALALHKNKESR